MVGTILYGPARETVNSMKMGNLIIIGGAEDKTGECLILKSFVNLSERQKQTS